MPEWSEHPLVRHAVEETDGTAEEVMFALHDLMVEIDERFPGVPYREVLSDPLEREGQDVNTFRRQLRKAGVCEADIALLCPMNKDRMQRRKLLSNNPYDERAVRV